MKAAILLFLPLLAYGQSGPSNPEYKRLTDEAFSQLTAGQCSPCLDNYQRAFAISKHSALSHLRAAVCAGACNDSPARDTLVETAVSIAWDLCLEILDKPGAYPEIPRGGPFERQVRQTARQWAIASGIRFDLMEELKTLRYLDQKYRLALDSMRSEHPDKNSPEQKAFFAEWVRQDSANLVRVEAIIAQYGFPGKSMVGERGASTVWLVLQHAPLEKQEQYFPLLTEAAEKGELKKSDWAYLLDRINMHKGLPQVYGSQVVSDPKTGAWVFHPIEDEANVNVRRAAVGLSPLEEYAQMMGVDWKLPRKE